MKKIILTSLAAFALLFSSCQKDYLATLPTDAVTPDVAFTNLKGADLAVHGMYSRMYGQWDSQDCNGESGFAIQDDMVGGSVVVVNRGNGWYGGYFSYTMHTNYRNRGPLFQWRQAYRYTKNANEIINRIDDIEATTDADKAKKAYLKAEAIAMRAYAHYRIAQRFANRYVPGQVNSQLSVPIKTELNNKAIPRESLEKVLTFCMEEYDKALAIMVGEGKEFARDRLYRFNTDVIYALKARIHMIRGEWALALAEAEKVITPGNYSIMGPSEMIGTWMSTAVRNKNREVLWGNEIMPTDGLYFYSFYMMIGTNNSGQIRGGAWAMDRRLFDSVLATDYRKNLYLQDDQATIDANNAATKGNYYFSGDGTKVYGPFGPTGSSTKYIPLMSRKFQSYDQSNNAGGDFILIRYAEVLYIAAEAAYNAGDMTKAAKYLTDANLPYDAAFTAKSGSALLQQIYDYKGFDLWGEGRAYEDIIRRGGTVDRTYEGYNGNLLLGIVEKASVIDNYTAYFKYQVPRSEINNSPDVVVGDKD